MTDKDTVSRLLLRSQLKSSRVSAVACKSVNGPGLTSAEDVIPVSTKAPIQFANLRDIQVREHWLRAFPFVSPFPSLVSSILAIS